MPTGPEDYGQLGSDYGQLGSDYGYMDQPEYYSDPYNRPVSRGGAY